MTLLVEHPALLSSSMYLSSDTLVGHSVTPASKARTHTAVLNNLWLHPASGSSLTLWLLLEYLQEWGDHSLTDWVSPCQEELHTLVSHQLIQLSPLRLHQSPLEETSTYLKKGMSSVDSRNYSPS